MSRTRNGLSTTDMMRAQREQIAASFSDKAYRDAFVEEQITAGVPFQIRALRLQRKWSQKTLGENSGMAQETISLLENPNYGRLTIRTLLRLASGFDVGLMLRFVPFSEIVNWTAALSQNNLEVPSYADDKRLASGSTETINLSSSPTSGLAYGLTASSAPGQVFGPIASLGTLLFDPVALPRPSGTAENITASREPAAA